MLSKLLAILILAGLSSSEAYVATAVATCESGNAVTFGTHSWTARSATNDGGAYQFNDATWKMLDAPTRQANYATPAVQTQYFLQLWNNGKGSSHWSASKKCWQKWISTDGYPTNQFHYNDFEYEYQQITEEVQERSCGKCY